MDQEQFQEARNQAEQMARQGYGQARRAGEEAAERASGVMQRAREKIRHVGEGVAARSRGEGPLTKSIEQVTSFIPSSGFLAAAVGSMIASAGLQMAGRKEDAMFVGQWAPALLILGLYNKLVKLEGSE